MTIELPNLNPSSLVDSNFVRLARRVDIDKVTAMVDNGSLLWVFDVSARPSGQASAHCRELRFLLSEIVTPQLCSRLTIREVIDRILPPLRRFFRGFEIRELLLIARPTLSRIARQMRGVIRNGEWQVSRQAFAAWLSARWIGNLTA